MCVHSQNWFDPGVKVVVSQYIWLKYLLGTVSNIFVEKYKMSIKKKKKADPCFLTFWVGGKRAHLFFRPNHGSTSNTSKSCDKRV